MVKYYQVRLAVAHIGGVCPRGQYLNRLHGLVIWYTGGGNRYEEKAGVDSPDIDNGMGRVDRHEPEGGARRT